jgi:hypothetical protein
MLLHQEKRGRGGRRLCVSGMVRGNASQAVARTTVDCLSSDCPSCDTTNGVSWAVYQALQVNQSRAGRVFCTVAAWCRSPLLRQLLGKGLLLGGNHRVGSFVYCQEVALAFQEMGLDAGSSCLPRWETWFSCRS